MKKLSLLFCSLVFVLGGAGSLSFAYDALQRPTELQYWDATRADNGYNFFGVSGTTYLLDMEGKVVHTWPVGNNPHLLNNGGVLDTNTNDPSGFSGFKEVAWDGTTVWTYLESRSTYHPHHDFTRIFNPKLNAYTTLYIANKDFTYAQLVAAGADPAKTPATGAQLDAIVEVDASGTIVWEWCFFDHIVQDIDVTKPNYVGAGNTVANFPNKLNINLDGHTLKADWLHCNSLDYNQSLDQIVINSVQGEFYVIDHGNTFVSGNPASSIALAATSAGDFLYRFGDPARYAQGDKPAILEDWTQSTQGHKQLGGAHDIQWIASGLPGAGHFLIFNNSEYLSEHTAQSYVVEVNPYLNANGVDTGAYVNPPSAGYNTVTFPAVMEKPARQISKQVVYNFSAKSPLTLFSQIGCSAQRLSNGNTLICADTEGYIMEVTPSGDTVWDYIVPVTSGGIVSVIGDRLAMVNSIFRAYRYKATDPALVGRTLTPGATIAGRTTVANPYAGTSGYQALQRQTETQYWDATNAANGYTFFGAAGNCYLIDMQGRVAHSWATGTDPRFLDSGHVLDWSTNGSGQTGLKELDWSGAMTWSYNETRAAYHPHGDFKRIYDPKLGAYATLYLANKDVTQAQCIAAGCDPADAPYTGAQVDTIVEVDMSGNVVWEWSFWDHGVQDVDASKANYVGSGKTISTYPGRINLNLPGRPLRSNWMDCNSIDYNQSLDQIVVNSRQGECYVIDHGNTFIAGNPTSSIALAASAAGDFLYRFGDPARYAQGSAPSIGTNWETSSTGNKQMGGSSNVQWIASGLTGAGHLLMFSNNQYLYQRTPQSYVLEVNPFLNSSGTDTGAYVNPPTAGYNTWTFDKDSMKANQSMSKQITWNYASVSNLTLFSHLGSSAQRLNNGNTLICATAQGYMVEVTSAGAVVWEYINPVTGTGIVSAIGDTLPMTNAVPRALRYAASYAGLQGHTLTPTATIVGNVFPTISNTTRAPLAPAAADAVKVTSTITDDGSISSATLTYVAGSGTPVTSTIFTETMGTTAVKPWTGSGSTYPWTVTGSTYFESRTGSNYVVSTTECGVQYKGKVTNNALSAAMFETTNVIDARGSAGYVEFWVQTQTLDGTDGWTFQTSADGGTTWNTRVSELTGASHAFQKFHYDLAAGELVSTLKLRFQFTGGGAADLDDRIDVDQITLSITSGGISTATLTMYDDGTHGDTTAGDHVYSASIPAQTTGTPVTYYVRATDNSGLVTTDPATAPAATYSYTVQLNQAPTDIALAPSSVAEEQPVGTTVGALSTVDPNTDNTFTYSLVSGTGSTDNATFSITGSSLKTAAVFHYVTKSSYSIRVRSTDQGGLFTEKALTVLVTSLSHPFTMSALPDSGQVAKYSTLAGEDADYTIHPPTYVDNGDGTITDKVTGLMWQKVDGGEMTFDQAVAYADALVLGGHSDWRLAFGIELFSIMDHSTLNPSLNSRFFTTSAAEYWWTSELQVEDTTKAWATNAGGGIGAHPKTETISAGGTKRFHVRCVREIVPSGTAHIFGNLTANGDGTITDNHTGLVWQQAESSLMTWEQALAYAESLSLGGQSDWRLPNVKELQSINDANFHGPSLDKTYFTGATATRYWSSTSVSNDATKAWYLDSDYGIVSYDPKTALWHVRCVRGGPMTNASTPVLSVIPAGSFEMGDHFNFTDPGHPTDEKPLHTVAISAFCLGTYDITNRQYCDYLNSALAQGLIEVRNGLVYAAPAGTTIYCETRSSTLYSVTYSGIVWDGTSFSVYNNRDTHPMVGVHWEGAAAYCNWLSVMQGYTPCYNLTTWVCNFAANGYRLPTEAEWEYAANGGRYYYMFPWGDYPNTDGTWANWEASADPYETGDYPWTTPVGFYNGQLHLKTEFNWPGSATSFQTSNAVNGYGLYDMAGNVWQWTNDWYGAGYYSVSSASNPTGPATGDAMPDGNPYHAMRGGNWYNGATLYGHARIANRNPGYFRGPDDPNHPYYHIGFRVALKSSNLTAPGASATAVVTNGTFFEGPAADVNGNVFFSDIAANTIYKLSNAGALSVFRTNSGGSNGLAFDKYGNLIACEGTTGRIVSISPQGGVSVIATQYNSLRFNEPNDLWIAPNGGIYFTDPVFFGTQTQDGQHVYYINPARTTVTRVIADMVKPNGIVGTADGSTLYVSDYGAGATYKYTINPDGTLTGKTLFVALGSDGMEIDSDGNVYLTTDDVQVYSSAGVKLQTINVLDRPTNLCFAGADRRTLYITTEAALYAVQMRTQGLPVLLANLAPVITATTQSPAAPAPGNTVWVTSHITDDKSITGATLTYSIGTSGTATNTVFREVFSNGSTNSGIAGATNAWTATSVRNVADVRQRSGSVNHTTPIVLANCTTNSGSTTVTCASTTGVAAGMLITGTNIAAATTVASVTNSTTLVLSANATGSGSALSLTAAGVTLANCTTTVGSNAVVCATTTGLVVGMGITGATTNPPNPTVASITDATHFTLNNNVTTASTNASFTAAGCGLEFNNGTVNYTDTMATTTNAINAASATSGSVEFYVRTADLVTNNGWTFQISPDGGTTWNTRLSETYEGSTVRLSGVTLNSANNQTTGSTTVTCASTTGLAAGMSIQGPALRLTGCNTVINTPTVTLTSTSGLGVGMFVVGTGIPNNTRILSVVANTSFTMSANATATSATAINVLANYFDVNTTVSSVTNATTFVVNNAAFYSASALTVDATTINHAFALKHYDLVSADKTANMKMRFQWSGTTATSPARAPVCDIDDITVVLTTGVPPVVVTMLDDGAHNDGAAGDGTYGASIPAQSLGTTVSYYLTATDNEALSSSDPFDAPTTLYSYVVQNPNTAPVITALTRSPTSPTQVTAPWITANVTDDTSVASVVLTYNVGAGNVNATMLDDGAHGDGLAGDHVYGAQIPAVPAGTSVSYSIKATDGPGLFTTSATNSYVVIFGQTVGVFLNNSASAYPGYTLVAPMHYTKTYLIDMAGQVVHRWSSAYEPGRAAYLLPNGHMIRAGMVMTGGPSTGGGEGGRIEEFDWDGNLVWAIDYLSSTYIHHHDFKVMPNGNILMLIAEKKTYAEVLALGFNPALLDSSISTQGYMLPDALVEVTPTGSYGGTVVWAWHMWDHTIQDYDNTKSNYGVVADHPELIDVNGPGIMIQQFWNHVNGIDYNPALNQVMLSVRGNNEVFVIDRGTTTAQAATHTGGTHGKGGDILYRWGDPQQYNRGTASNRQLYQQHHTHWIEPGLPGAGNILIFNNGIGRGYSSVNEIVPPVDGSGNYALTTGAAYGPAAPIWTYTATPPTSFYSDEISGAQRLPNGNTLICEGIHGRLFEVTSAGETVWSWICPVTTEVLTQGNTIAIDAARPAQLMNAVFRADRYALNYTGLAGRDLTPQGLLELPVDQTLRIATTASASGGNVTFSWVSLPDRTYTIEYSTTLIGASWTPIATVQSIGTMTTFTDTFSARTGQARGFYRVRGQ